jgi:hypothetical protein
MREFHPVANIFPLMEGKAFDEFIEDVRSNGLREPVTLHPDGRVVDGRNRYRACERVGIEPVYRTWDESVHGDLVKFVCSLNLQRRMLDESQRAMVAAKIANLGDGQRASATPMGVAQPEAAAMLNVGTTSVQRARKVLKDGAASLVEAVERGDVSVRQAADIATLELAKQAELVALPREERQRVVDDIRKEHASSPRANVAHMPTTPRIGPPSNGLQFARIAIMKLEEIRENDIERQQAFDLVRSWLDGREAKTQLHA